MGFFPPALRSRLFGSPWGEVYPPRPNPHPPAVDGRTVALETLREYICALRFFRPGAPGTPDIPFVIEPQNFHIEWPDDPKAMVFPSIAVINSRGNYDVIGLVSYIEEDTRDVFAPGTVVQWQSEYVETINLEIWANTRPERRALISGIETAISPTEQMSGVRFSMPGYFNELVCFTLNRREVIDNPSSAERRRSAQLEIEMRFNIVALVNYVEFAPQLKAVVDVDEDTGIPIGPPAMGLPPGS